MIEEDKDLSQAEGAPRRRQRIAARDTERVYSASQDQGERFDTVETERYIKRVIQAKSKEELTAALRALKEQAMPKKKRGRPSKRDQEEQRILMETIARHMDEINATRAALIGDISGQPIDFFVDDALLDASADTGSADSDAPAEVPVEVPAETGEHGDDVPDFIRMQQSEASADGDAAEAEEDAVPALEQSHQPQTVGEESPVEAETSREPDAEDHEGQLDTCACQPVTLGMLYASGSDFVIVQDVPQLPNIDFVSESPSAAYNPLSRTDGVPDYLARTRSFLNYAGAPVAPRIQQPLCEADSAVGIRSNVEIELTCEGVLDVGDKDKQGILRSSDYNYLASPDDVFISLQQIRQYALKCGDVVCCKCRPPRVGETKYVFLEPISINGLDPQRIRDRVNFEHLTPLFPDVQFRLSRNDSRSPLSCRIVDLFAPIGKGQRALIVAQPKTGKTVLMKQVANAIAANNPETYLMMLLIDERPEEVTDMSRTVNAEVIASTFDESASNHTRIAQIVLEKAKRMVECGRDVVIFLDSITRLARAFNAITPMSGRILTGGVDANALQMPKRFFGAARNIENGGSLTIIATALIDTGSRMDEVIFEEFKGTGNMELVLDRNLANKRIFPAVNLIQSSTRREDLLLDEQTVNRMFVTRNYMADMSPVEAMNFIKRRLEDTVNNEEFIATINR